MIYNSLYIITIIFCTWRSTRIQKLYFIILLVPLLPIVLELNIGFKFSFYNPELHTFAILTKSLYVALLVIICLKVGFIMSKKIKQLVVEYKPPSFSYQLLLVLPALFLLKINSPSGTILGEYKYGITEQSKAIAVNVIPLLFFLLIILMIMGSYHYKKFGLPRKIILISIFVYGIVFLGLLTGNRVEQLGIIVATYFVISQNVSPKVNGWLFVGLILSVGFIWLIGFFRSSGELNWSRVLTQFMTFSDIANTHLIAIGVIDQKNETYWGINIFIDMLKSTLPASISPFERPVPLARFYHEYYDTMGGAYWPGVLYLSFGWYAGIYAGFTGFVLGSIEKSAKYSNFASFVMLGFTIVSFRWMYYGGITVYRMITIILIVIVLYEIFKKLLNLNGLKDDK